MVAALHPTKKHAERGSSYPLYSTVLNLIGIQFPMTLSQIKRFENFSDISINIYLIEEQKEILPLRLSDRKRGKHVNLLYVSNPCNDNIGHFAFHHFGSRIYLALQDHKLQQERIEYIFLIGIHLKKKKIINIFSNIFFNK